MTKSNKKAAGAINTNGLHIDTNGVNFLTTDATGQAPSSEAISALIERLALAGHHVINGREGDFTVCKYGMTRHCADFAELAAFARQLGVNHE